MSDPGGGRRAPHNLQAEESLLGAMLLSADAIAAAIEHTSGDRFYKPNHGYIFDTIVKLWTAGQPSDPVTVADGLHRDKLLDQVGGLAALLSLQVNTPATSNAARYARIVEEHALLRDLLRVGEELLAIGYSIPDDVAAAVERAQGMVFDVGARASGGATVLLADALNATMDHLDDLYQRNESVTGTPTGYTDLDALTAGLQPDHLVIVGARPSMGKTAFALGAAAHAAIMMGRPVLMFSLEMSSQEIAGRLLAQHSKVDATHLRTGKVHDAEWARISNTVGQLGGLPFYIDDSPRTTLLDMRARARRLQSRIGTLGLVVVDYLQLMSGSTSENRQQEVSEVSRGLKILARELRCPVMALSQLSRNVELRADKRPQLSDLRESGSLEQDADQVMFLYREEMYDPNTSDRGLAEVILAKNRTGPTGTIRLAFLAQYTRFANMARDTL